MRIDRVSDMTIMSGTSEIKGLKNELAIAKSRSNDGDKKAEEEVRKLNRELRLSEMEAKEARRQERLKELSDSNEDTKKAVSDVEEKKSLKTDEVKEEDKELKSVSKNDEEKSEIIDELKRTRNIFFAQTAMEQMNVRGNAKDAIEGRISVLEAEIGSDKLRGTDTAAKEEELSKLREGNVEIEGIFKNEEPDEMDDEAIMKYFGGPKGFFKNTGSYDEETPKMVIS